MPYLDFLEDEDVFWRLAKVEPDAVVLTTLARKSAEGCAAWPVLFDLAVEMAGPWRSRPCSWPGAFSMRTFDVLHDRMWDQLRVCGYRACPRCTPVYSGPRMISSTGRRL